jgi:hypothetical protein
MQISESSMFTGSSWIDYINPTIFELSSGNALKEVYYRLKNAEGTISKSVNKSITLDTTTTSPEVSVTVISAGGAASTSAITNAFVASATVNSGDPIPFDAIFEIVVYDSTGVDGPSVIITLDNVPVLPTIVTDTPTRKVYRYAPPSQLADGNHSLTIRAGNVRGYLNTVAYTRLGVYATAAIIGTPTVSPAVFSPSAGPLTITYVLTKNANTSIYIYGADGQMAWIKNNSAGAAGGSAGTNSVAYNGISTTSNTNLAQGIYVFKIIADGNRVIGKGHITVYGK